MIQKIKEKTHKALRWSEQYTKTDMVYVARGGFWSVVGQIVSSVTTFIFAIVVARYLPKEVYGEYKYIIGAVALLSSFSLTGLGTAVFQSVASGYDGALREGFWENIRWSALIFIGAFGMAAYYYTHGDHTLALGLLIGGSLSPFLTSANLIGQFLNAKKDFRGTAIYIGIIQTILSSGSLIIAILFTHNPLILSITYFIGNTISTIWVYLHVIQAYSPNKTRTDPEMMAYAKHLSLIGIFNTIAGNIDQVLLFHFVGPVELAIYNFATAIPDQAKSLFGAVNTMMQVKFVTRPDKEIHESMGNKIFWLTISTIIFIFLYILFSPYFYRIFFPKYIDAVPYSQIYAVSTLSFIFTPAASYLVAKKKVSEQYMSNVAGSFLQIALLTTGTALFGLWGLIVARVIFRILNSFLAFVLYKSSLQKNNYLRYV